MCHAHVQEYFVVRTILDLDILNQVARAEFEHGFTDRYLRLCRAYLEQAGNRRNNHGTDLSEVTLFKGHVSVLYINGVLEHTSSK